MSENNHFKEGGLIENMAQTAALFAGVKFMDAGEEVPLGYIAGIKNVEVHQLPKVGTKISTRATLINELMNIQIVEGLVYDEQDQLIARSELRIFIDALKEKV